MSSSGPPHRRKDAARNRAALLAAAGEIFERDGIGAPLEDIATAAGLSRASLARHFPSREDLIAALWEADVIALESTAESVKELPDGLIRLFDAVVGRQVDRRSIRPTPNQLQHGDLDQIASRLAAAIQETLPAARRSGCARGGLDLADVMLAIEMCADVITSPPERERRAGRWRSSRILILPGIVSSEWIAEHPELLDRPIAP
ncbi:helix-turn-helix domain-containing protein [Rathayibacter sp. YIM 133350]|uniref:TetR/AcrR family transcriptional regulator n=1 Tax=Rathayibacter sp. YIM 133350 TaxID=3131992 RepID=UPI00307CE505